MNGQSYPSNKRPKKSPSILNKFFLIGMAIIALAILILLILKINPFTSGRNHLLTDGDSDVLVIMPLGNSITYGNYHPEPRPEGLITGYRQSLWLMLKEAGYNVDFVGNVVAGQDADPPFDPDNEGHPGWTDDQIGANVYKWLKKTPADYIILHIGTNGLHPDPADVEHILNEIDRYEADYGRHIRVIMAKIINRSTYSQLTTEFNFNIEKMAFDRVRDQGDDLTVIDMEFETGINYELFTHDGEMFDNLHPYTGGHRKMAVRWFEILREVLPRPDDRPYFTSYPNPAAVAGDPYTYQPVAGGSPAPAFTLAVSPAGMQMDDESGMLTWTPEMKGSYPVTLIARNADGVDSQKFEIRVRDRDRRVQDGLVALYEFTEGSGNLVHDVSRTGLPLDLYINNAGNVIWDDEQGLEITREAILTASGNNTKLVDSLRSSNEVTIELWLRTGNMEQSGPSHILTVADPLSSGLSVSQDHDYEDGARYYFTRHLQTSETGPDGSTAFYSDDLHDRISLQHIIYTRKATGEERFYINGLPSGTGMAEGTFARWESTLDLALGNGFGFENAWTGKLFLAAIYNRALDEREVTQNFEAGFASRGTMGSDLPDVPLMLRSEALSVIASRLTWESVGSGASGYLIERKEDNGQFHYTDMVPSGVNEYVDAGLIADTRYSYRIKAINDLGESGYSDESTVRTFKDDGLTNVALNKAAKQSSKTYRGDASRAVDGNTDGSFANKSVTHTAYELNAWWEVDLGDAYDISHLEVWNRTDLCCKDRMARFYVFVSETPFESYDFQETLNQEGVWYEYQEHFPEPMVAFNVSRKGRYVRLQLSDSQEICLAEMIVMGSLPE